MVDTDKIILMDQKRIERSLKRIAHQIAERNRDDKQLVLIGINTRGYSVATAIRNYLSSQYGDIICRQLMVDNPSFEGWDKGKNTEKKFKVLVDDVIFSGSTMFKALLLLHSHEELQEIHTAVLVDRGHHKLPLQAEFVGLELPTKLNEHVSVEVSNDGKVQQVLLEKS